MKDRNVEFPNRYRMVKVPGTDDIFDLTPAPGEISDEGTFINKASLLKDATAALFGLGADAVPDDVLGVLSRFHNGIGNEYVWGKSIPQHMDVANLNGQNVLDPNLSTKMQYADSVAIDSSGNITLVNPQNVTSSVDNIVSNPSLLRGKYIKTQSDLSNAPGFVCRVTTTATFWKSGRFLRPYDNSVYVIEAKIDFESYASSGDANAYPVEDGYVYTALGKLGGAFEGAKITTGSYKGAGNTVCGESNARSLTFPFAPKMVWISSATGGGTLVFYPLTLTSSYTVRGYTYTNSNISTIYQESGFAKISGNTLTWYHQSNGSLQGNDSSTYYYVAIG